MANVIHRIISSADDQRLTLVGEQAGRTISIGSNWTQLRVLMLYSADSADSSITIPTFYFGMSSGTASMPGDASVNHFLGLSMQPNLVLGVNQTSYWRTGSGSTTIGRLTKIQNNAASTTSAGAGNAYWYMARSAHIRKAILINITKGATWTVQAIQSHNTADIPPSDISTLMATGILPSAINFFNTTTAVDQATYGDLDSLCLSWGHDTIPLEISDLAYMRVS